MPKDFQVVRRGGKQYFRMKLEGLDLMAKELHDMAGELAAEEGLQIARASMAPLTDEVRRNVPVDRGLLKESIRMTKGRRDKRGIVISTLAGYRHRRTGKGKKRAAYALQVEYGTSKYRPQPFMRPAFDGKERKYIDAIVRHTNLRVIKWRFKQRLKAK